MGKWTQEELTCPECGWVAKNPNGLRGHRQFKHGVRASGAQLPLQEQDRLVTESVLEQRIEESLGEVIEQVGSEVAAIKQQLKQLAEQPLEQPDLALVGGLEQRVSELESDYRADQKFAVTFAKQVDPLKAKVLKLHLCPDCGAPLHIHHYEKRFHLECLECGFCSSDYEYPKWKVREKLGVLEQREVEQEEPEKPYLHIIDEPREGYSPWTEGKWAKIIE